MSGGDTSPARFHLICCFPSNSCRVIAVRPSAARHVVTYLTAYSAPRRVTVHPILSVWLLLSLSLSLSLSRLLAPRPFRRRDLRYPACRPALSISRTSDRISAFRAIETSTISSRDWLARAADDVNPRRLFDGRTSSLLQSAAAAVAVACPLGHHHVCR